MPNQATKSNFDSIMNRIVKDTLLVACVIIIGLIAYGTIKEHGDQNAGGMYGLFIIPLIPVVLIAFGIIQISKKYLSLKTSWLSSFMPLIFLVLTTWLKTNEAYILTVVLFFIVFFSCMKHLFKSA